MQILNYEWVGVESIFFAKKDAEIRDSELGKLCCKYVRKVYWRIQRYHP